MPSDWIMPIIAIGTVVVCAFAGVAIRARMRDRNNGKRLAEPFSAEVLYQGEVIAYLTDSEFIEMFWREYRIEPRTDESREIIANDELWERCAFEFRDPATGNVCTSAFVGGTKPFIKNGRVALRGLHFGG